MSALGSIVVIIRWTASVSGVVPRGDSCMTVFMRPMSTGVPGGMLYWPSSKPTEKNWPAGVGLSRLNSVRTPSAVAISAAVFTESPSSAHRVTFTRAILPPDEMIREPPAAFMDPELSTIQMRSGKACADACIVCSSPGGNP